MAVPLVLADPDTGAILGFLSTTTFFGSDTDAMLAGLALECFYPADVATRAALLNRTASRD